ncbi:hypothetical protein D3C73_897280 [compost metagenome]
MSQKFPHKLSELRFGNRFRHSSEMGCPSGAFRSVRLATWCNSPRSGSKKEESLLRRLVRGASVREDGISPVAEKRDRSPDTPSRKFRFGSFRLKRPPDWSNSINKPCKLDCLASATVSANRIGAHVISSMGRFCAQSKNPASLPV